MFIGDGDPTEHGANDAQKSLVGTAEKQVFQRRKTIHKFLGGTIDAAVVVSGEATDGARGEDIGIDHMRAKIGDVFQCTIDDAVVPELFFAEVLLFRQVHPVVRIGEGGDAYAAIFEWFGVVEVVG